MPSLRIADELALPLDYITKTAAILAQRRKGKTYTASVLAEEFVAASLPFVALDPTGAWWGLRASANGTSAGLPVVIIGGQHGDLPLERGAGRFIADLVLDHPGFYVIDFSLLGHRAAEREFATAFADRLYRRKMQPGMDFPLHLFVDEADMFVPQDRESGDAHMLGAFQAIVRRGGLHGLGTTLISQRPALVNKSVLTQLDVLILLRLVAGNDQDAVDKNYISRAGTKEQRAELMGSIASLALGEAWVWEPGAEPPLYERVRIRQRTTFNSSATPKPGERRIEPRRLADVDIAAIKEAMAATIEKAKEDDPAELRRRIADLQRQLRERPAETEKVVEYVETPVLTDEHLAEVARIVELAPMIEAATASITMLALTIGEHRRAKLASPREFPRGTPRAPRPSQPVAKPEAAPVGDAKLGKGERTVLGVLAEYPEGRTSNELAFLAGYSAKASTLGVILASLRKAGLVEPGQPIRPTREGLAAVGGARERPRGQALLDQWLRHPRMGEGERRVLKALIDMYPSVPSHEELCDATGYSAGASTMGVILSKLRKLGLVEKSSRSAAPEFMEAIRG